MNQKRRFHSSNCGLGAGFWRSVEQFPTRPALVVQNEEYTYEGLSEKTIQLARLIQKAEAGEEQEVVGIFASRSLTAYSGVLGILTSGRGYLPLNPKFPLERTIYMIEAAKVSTIIVGIEAMASLAKLLPLINRRLNIILPIAESELKNINTTSQNHRFFSIKDSGENDKTWISLAPSMEKTAYLLFTSGSTGNPKGVPVSHKNVTSYLEHVIKRYDFSEFDRFSQMFDMTFDLSVHDMFVCWGSGACLYSIPEKIVMSPSKFIQDHELTVWFSVPSVPMFMQKLKLLKPNSFSSLRYSFFCGEALLQGIAEAWHEAANNSVVENLYGPTEATIAISQYRWDKERSPGECKNGLVPIGKIFPTQDWRVVCEDLDEQSVGEIGELYLSGTQVTTGYLNDEEKTKKAYVIFPDEPNKVWYRTGDLVMLNESNELHYIGRTDNQLKIMGYRVEIQEIEHVLLKTGAAFAIVVPLLKQNEQVEGVCAYLPLEFETKCPEILLYCQEKLPFYMVPKKLLFVEDVPLNSNGKVDRKQLMKQLMEVLR